MTTVPLTSNHAQLIVALKYRFQPKMAAVATRFTAYGLPHRISNLARLANSLEGLYILPMFFL